MKPVPGRLATALAGAVGVVLTVRSWCESDMVGLVLGCIIIASCVLVAIDNTDHEG